MATVEGKPRLEDLVATAKKCDPMMSGEGADVVVFTAHAGNSGFSFYGGRLPVENASALVAQQVPTVDEVLFGRARSDVPQTFVTNSATGKQVLLAEPALCGKSASRSWTSPSRP